MGDLVFYAPVPEMIHTTRVLYWLYQTGYIQWWWKYKEIAKFFQHPRKYGLRSWILETSDTLYEIYHNESKLYIQKLRDDLSQKTTETLNLYVRISEIVIYLLFVTF